MLEHLDHQIPAIRLSQAVHLTLRWYTSSDTSRAYGYSSSFTSDAMDVRSTGTAC
jgi:hypothetical protein